MTALKRIVIASYETTDGKTFSDKGEAAKHQAHLNRIKNIAVLVKAGMATNATEPTDELALDVAQFIVDNADALREILPKRAKSVAPASQTGLVGSQEPVTLQGHDDLVPASTAAFSFPAGLVNNVGNQQANANA
jgi:phosphoenolpyruvate-protein kinase (PTS system EI component)